MNNVTVLRVEIISISSLFIGDGTDLFLTDNESGMAYLPATSIAGSFRAYLKNIGESYYELFGEQKEEHKSLMSSVFISDAFAELSGVERRIGLKIDPEKGSNVEGSKIDRHYLSSGLKFELVFEIHNKKADENGRRVLMLYKCLKALDKGYIRFGGNKSNGLGNFKILSAKETVFVLNNKDSWVAFLNDDYSRFDNVINKIEEVSVGRGYVEFNMRGQFTTPVLIKSPDLAETEDADYKSIKSGNDYIVPGSSFKGVLRSRIEKIANYFGNINEVKALFGDEKDNKMHNGDKHENEKNKLSRVLVSEVVLDIDNNHKERKYNRIRIDRFTGGVMKTALMQDIPIQGSCSFKVLYRKQDNNVKDNYAIGIIALALRDLGTENLVIGGGCSIGRGRFKGEKMSIADGKTSIEIDFKSKTISDKDIMNKYVGTVKDFALKKGEQYV